MDSEEFTTELIEQTPAGRLLKEGNDITAQIVAEQDPDKLKDLTALFEMNQKKKDIARINKLNNLLEVVDDEVIMRMTSEPESFENETLLKYMNSTQQAISNIRNDINQTPLVQINNTKQEIHINESGLNRESRQKVLDAVMAILESSKTNSIDAEYEVEE